MKKIGLILTVLLSMLNSSIALENIKVPATTAQKWVLPNGLTLIVDEDHSVPVASVQAWCATGSIHEDERLGAGLSHILEHMLFKGTETRTTNGIAQKVQDVGGYINAYTSYERTVYYINVPSKGASMAIDILSDAMMNSTLPAGEYTKEQEVIRREYAMNYDDPDRISSRRLFETAYREHPYRVPVIGYLDVYNKLTREDVLRYYKERYVPNNLFFVVVGDVDAAKVYAQVEEYFRKYPRKSLEPVFIPEEPRQMGKRISHEEFSTEHTHLHLAWHIPSLTHPDMPALDLLAVALGQGTSSRLFRAVREKEGLVHSVSAYSYTPSQAGLFGVEALLDPENRARAEEAVERVIKEVQEKGITVEELEKAKRQILSHQISALTTMEGKASDLGSNWLLTGNLDFSRDYLNALQKVTLEDVKRVSRTYLFEDNLTVVSLNPPGSLEKKEIKAAAAEGNEIQKFELPNGIRLLVREDTRLPLVSSIAVFKAGLLAEDKKNNGVTQLLSKVMLKGTTDKSAEQISDLIEGVGGSIGSNAGNNSFSISVDTLKPDLTLGVKLLADVIKNPSLPEKVIEREKQVQIAGIKAQEDNVQSVAFNLLREKMYPDHPFGLRTLGTPESVASLNREMLKSFHEKYVVGSNCVIAVFGDVKAAEVKALVEKEFGSLPRGEVRLTDIAKVQPLTGEIEVEKNKNKTQAVIMVGYLGVDLFDPDRYAFSILNEACSDLGSRFFIRIRENLGLAYYVGASQFLGLARGPFYFYLGTSPGEVEKVKKELLDEINNLAKGGLEEQEIVRAKEKLLGQNEIRKQSPSDFAYMVALDELYGLGYDNYKREKELINAVTGEKIRQVAKQYFENQGRITAVVKPETTTKNSKE